MRLTAQAAMSPRFTTRLRTRGTLPGLAKSQKASTIWNQPARANCRPSIVEASAWEPTMTRWMAPAATEKSGQQRADAQAELGLVGGRPGRAVGRCVDRGHRWFPLLVPSTPRARTTAYVATGDG